MNKPAATDTQDLDDIQSALAGSEVAFAMLVERHEATVAKIMWRFSRDPDEHESLVHDVFVEVFLSLAGFNGSAPFAHWISRIATFVGYGYWKRRAKERKLVQLDQIASLAAPEAPEPTEEPFGSRVTMLLAELAPTDRLVIMLTYAEGLNAKEIAARMGWTHTMTRMRLSRARKRLRKMAEQQGLQEEMV